MKHYSRHSVIITLFLFLSISVSAQNEKTTGKEFEPFTRDAEIEIVLRGASQGISKLIGVYGNQNILEDSLLADANGKVVFKRAGRYIPGIYYVTFSDNSILTLLLDRNQKFFLHADKADINNTVKTSSAENELYYQNQVYETGLAKREQLIRDSMAVHAPGSAEYNALGKKINDLIAEKEQVVKGYQQKYPGSFFVAFKTAGQNPMLHDIRKPDGEIDSAAQTIMFRKEFWDTYDFNDERLLNTPVYYNKLNKYLTSLFPQHVDSIMKGAKFILEKTEKGNKELFSFTVNHLLLTYKKSKIMGGEKIFCYTADNYFTHKKAFWTDSVNIVRTRMQADQMRPSLLGAKGQDLRCKNQQGEYKSLYEIRKPIRVVYLYNPDCEHCQKETPKLKVLYDKWKSRGLEVYALNVESDYGKWNKFISDLNLDWVNVIDPKFESQYFKKYYIDDTPAVYVLDSANTIVAKQVMPEYLEIVFEDMVK